MIPPIFVMGDGKVELVFPNGKMVPIPDAVEVPFVKQIVDMAYTACAEAMNGKPFTAQTNQESFTQGFYAGQNFLADQVRKVIDG